MAAAQAPVLRTHASATFVYAVVLTYQGLSLALHVNPCALEALTKAWALCRRHGSLKGLDISRAPTQPPACRVRQALRCAIVLQVVLALSLGKQAGCVLSSSRVCA